VTCDRRLFHRRAAATGNALSPTVDRRVRRTSRDVDKAERIGPVTLLQCALLSHDAGKESEKRCDLRRQQKIEREGTSVTCDGRLFHRRAAATGNALLLTVDRRVRRTSRDADKAERRPSHLASMCFTQSVRQTLVDVGLYYSD